LIGKRAAYYHDRSKHNKKQWIQDEEYLCILDNVSCSLSNDGNTSKSTTLGLLDYALPGYMKVQMVGEKNQKCFQTELRTGLARFGWSITI
jgi:hypothetical protein